MNWVWAIAGVIVGAAPDADVDFQRDVRPILAEHCLACHGADAINRLGGLRLDARDGALRGGESETPAIVPGKPDESELIRRVESGDAEELMPPPSHNKPLSAAQVATLRRWIVDGAAYEGHWAFRGPRKAPLPSVAQAAAHPIDAFIGKALADRKAAMSPPAPPPILCRRLYLDLIGVPPSPEEVDAFERESYDATVERLLASERFGEKWARHWLDVARYSDTNGYEKDLRREQWKWRDWVVDAFNADMPYDRFLIEQIAGDLLDDASQPQRIATGFLRNSMINEEGAIVAEQFRMVEMFDRMDCLGKAILGLTAQCAQCHSHKFDPLTQEEYYGVFAFLNNAYEAQSWVYSDDERGRIDRIAESIRTVQDRVRSERPRWIEEFTAWSDAIVAHPVVWEPIRAVELGSVSGLNHPTRESDDSILMKGHTSADIFLVADPDLAGVTGFRIETLTHGDLPFRGPGRGRLGNWAIREWEVWIQRPGIADWEKLKLTQPIADFSEPERKQADGKTSSGPVAHLVDGVEETTWNADRGPGRRNEPSAAAVSLETPLAVPPGTRLKLVLRMADMVGRCRFSLTRGTSPSLPATDHGVAAALLAARDTGSPDARTAVASDPAVFSAWMRTVPEWQPAVAEIDAAWARFPEAATSILHLIEREPGDARPTFFLDRGNWDQPTHAVEPHTPAALHAWPAGAPRNRLGFAHWLAARESPLTARVAVNRIWQSIFGTGLLETPEDFGTRSPVPVHRELLDWLSVDFMEHGWSHKHVIRMIVTSSAYRQTSDVTPGLLEWDPRNVWLSRGPRFRADAEVVRDVALGAAGLLHHRLGGPPVIPPIPKNVLEYNYTYPDYWTPAEGTDRYRRALYGFRKRSMPDPVMNVLDGPNGDTACARRVRSNTPLAALAVLNEPIFVEAARGLALRVLREGGATDAERTKYAFRLCAARFPTSAECDTIMSLLDHARARVGDGWLNPRAIATGDSAKLPDLPEGVTPRDAAAWTLAARVLINLDETLTKN
ncbi:MAG: DUF1553 domain-containing protein [Planctomycetes bacterium]|nr:DUF1553 domain-containing protein [Planctomycetota bacterium]